VSHIDDLIKELAPKGVPVRPLGEIGVFIRGRRFTKADRVDEGLPSIHYGEIYTHYRVAASEAITHVRADLAPTLRFARSGDVIIAAVGETVEDVGKAVAWLGAEQAAVHDDSFIFRSSLDPKFVVYFMQAAAFNKPKEAFVARAKVKRLSSDGLAKLRIPVPPIEVQREIVRVLDLFNSLDAELEAELRARRRQYAHYLRSLLLHPTDGNARWGTLGEIGRVAMCKRVFKGETTPVGDIPFYKIGTFGGRADAFISKELYEDYRCRYTFPKTGDVLVSAAGTIGRAIQYDGEAAYFQDSNIVWISNDESVVTNRFLFYWYQVIEWTTDGGTIRRLYNDNLRRAKILIPPLSQQRHIVGILDKFDAVVNDLSIGLPAELTARRKQYEYYRDRLLTFEELAA
jgi:type I restriction enzyme S subunit